MSTRLKSGKKGRMVTLLGQRMMGSLVRAAGPFLEGQKLLIGELPPESSKLQCLVSYLQILWNRCPNEKVLVFTQFVETHRELMAGLSTLTSASQIIGGQTVAERQKEVERFRAETRLLISTDAGSEGKNLQFCHHLVNFDIPWNPMRIEQRLGRLHRFGQEEPVVIVNLCQKGTVEEGILDLLDSKLNMFEMAVGELGAILGEVEEEKSFEEIPDPFSCASRRKRFYVGAAEGRGVLLG